MLMGRKKSLKHSVGTFMVHQFKLPFQPFYYVYNANSHSASRPE